MNIHRGMFTFMLALLSASCRQLSETQLERKIHRVEEGLLIDQTDPSFNGMGLNDRMEFYNVPGVSIAIINAYQIEWAKGYGVLEAGKSQSVTANTLFQTGSTAKPIVAATALTYVDAGHLDMDRDVNDYLRSWKVPGNYHTEVAPVTLRRLLSHNAGIDHIPLFGYAQGLPLPSLHEILDGKPPANSEPVRVLATPGSQYSYSNGGYLIVEQLLIDISGKPFDTITEETIFKPLGMDATTNQSPLPEFLKPAAASGHMQDGNPLPGGWNNFPEMGPGGSWWSTPSDLARFYIELMLAFTNQSDTILSNHMAIEMLTPQIEDRGLGPWIGDDGGNRFYFGHPGHNHGYKTYIVMYPERGQGLVIMTNSENGDKLYDEILNSVSKEYGWLRDNTILYSVLTSTILLIISAMIINHRKKRIQNT